VSRRGSARKFCSANHRYAFSAALRRYGLAQLDAGYITVDTLKGGQQSVHALSAHAQTEAKAKGSLP
jgi:hypothetical protein